MITVFTPTYNRAYIIEELYNSLLSQNYKDFEWLIVDDGSTDQTEELISNFITEGFITIRYFKQENGGKHRAINKGVALARGELFFIVDSDDYLYNNALDRVFYHYSNVKDNPIFAGVSGMRYTPDGEKIGSSTNFDIIDCPGIHFGAVFGINGDNAEVYKTEILKKFPFPEIEDEKFCPEGLIWNRLSNKYKMRFFNEGIYICEYLADGLSASSVRRRIESYQYSMLYYSESYFSKITFKNVIKSGINFWRFKFHSKLINTKIKIVPPTIFLMPFGFLMFIKDKITIK